MVVNIQIIGVPKGINQNNRTEKKIKDIMQEDIP